MDEQELIKHLKQGDPKAFRILVEQHQGRVINTCYRFLFNREDAEETAQEVFIEVHRSVGAFREEAGLFTWIYRIAVNKSTDAIRKKKRKKRAAAVKSLFALQEEGKDIPAPERENPSLSMEQRERLEIMQKAIQTLPENQKVSFTLSKCQGFNNREIAQIMGASLSSVESLVHRARKNLQTKLYHHFEGDLKKGKKIKKGKNILQIFASFFGV